MLDEMLAKRKQDILNNNMSNAYSDLNVSLEAISDIPKGFVGGLVSIPETYLSKISGSLRKYMTSTESRIESLRKRLDKEEAAFNAVEDDFNDSISVALNVGGTSAAFMIDGGYTADPFKDFKEDDVLIKSVIDYTEKTVDTYNRYITRDMIKYVEGDSSPTHPLSNFPDNVMKQKEFLYNTTVEYTDDWSGTKSLLSASRDAYVKVYYGKINPRQQLAGIKSNIAKFTSIKKSDVSDLISDINERLDYLEGIIKTVKKIDNDIIKTSKSFERTLKTIVSKDIEIDTNTSSKLLAYHKVLLSNITEPLTTVMKREVDLLDVYITFLLQIRRSLVSNRK